jgi:ribosome-associated protein
VTKKKTPKPTVKHSKATRPIATAKKKTAGKGGAKDKEPAKGRVGGAGKSAKGAQVGKGLKGGNKGGNKGGSKAKRPVARPLREVQLDVPALRPGEERERRESLASAKAAVAAALDKKAVEPVLIDVCGRSSYADFIVVVSGRSDRQVDAIADGVCEALSARGRRPLGREGVRNGRWVLIDFGDVVVHVFYHPLREVFDLESLWIDAPRVKLQIPAEARADAAPGRDT